MKKYDYIIKAYVKKHKKQKVYMMIGLILACTLFTIISYVLSIENEINHNEIYQNRGYYDVAIKEDGSGKSYRLKNNIYTKISENITEDKAVKVFNTNKVIDLYSINEATLKNIFQNQIQIINGKLPSGDNEIILSKDSIESLGKKLNDKVRVGDTTYKIVGEYKFGEGNNLGVITYSEDEEKNSYVGSAIMSGNLQNYTDKYMLVKFENGLSENEIAKILEKNNINIFTQNHRLPFRIEEVVTTIIVGIINILTTIILMYGSINIGIIEKEKYYSLLRCIGITKNKLMYLLLKENLTVGIISVPFGVFLGYCIVELNKVRIVESLSYGTVSEGLIKSISLNDGIFFRGILMGVAMLLISSIIPIIRLGKKSPIEGLKEVKRNRKVKVRKNKLLRKLNYNGYLAYRNTRRNGRRFNLAIVMLSIIGILFSVIIGYYHFTKQYINLDRTELGGSIIGFSKGDFNKINELEDYIESISKNKGQTIVINKQSGMRLTRSFGEPRSIDIIGCNDNAFNKIRKEVTGSEEGKGNENEIILVRGYGKNNDGVLEKMKGRNIDFKLEVNNEKIVLKGKYLGEIKDKKLSELGNANEDKIILPLDEYRNIFKKLQGQDDNEFVEVEFNINDMDENNIKMIEKKARALKLGFLNKKEITESNQKYLETCMRLIAILFGLIILNMMINMINNNYINMSLRKKEFANIMAIGVDKERLKKILMLEGVLTWVVSSIVAGVVSLIGITIIYFVFNIQGMEQSSFPPYWIGGVGILFMLPINMIVTLLPIKSMKIESLAELMRED